MEAAASQTVLFILAKFLNTVCLGTPSIPHFTPLFNRYSISYAAKLENSHHFQFILLLFVFIQTSALVLYKNMMKYSPKILKP